MKVLTVVGARPQFVKAAAVSRALGKHGGFSETIVHTGQHYDWELSEVFFEELGIPTPSVDLGVGSGRQGWQTAKMLEGLELQMFERQPDLVIVYGDTNSTLAGALAAAKLHIPLAHVESGLRSFNRAMPEEVNRLLTDHLATVMFAPTRHAVANLQREGISTDAVHLVGDVMYDAAISYRELATERTAIFESVAVSSNDYILATVHRAENTDDLQRLRRIFDALMAISIEKPVVLPLHPRTRSALEKLRWRPSDTGTLHLIEPVGYLDMMALELNSSLIVTDSGGVQKEAFFHGRRCVTLRTETEWVELVEHGWNVLAPPDDVEKVAYTVLTTLSGPVPARPKELYGGGHASAKIARILARL